MKNIDRLTVAALALLASSVLHAQSAAYSKEEEPLVERAKVAAAYGLKDPSSAQFRNLFVSYMPNYVCGEINAKNSYGAYVGFKLFFYDDNTNEVTRIDPEDTFYEVESQMMKMICK